ncbi:MAG TPA: J domain-containing protein [Beijerinckiaceae bacterium]|jgi:DnaJ-class molecular chaperone
MRDPYEVLGVPRTASEAEIKKAFRRLAKEHHPDRASGDPKAKDKFAEANQAYEILSDAGKRAQFDRGEIDAEGKPRFQGFEGFTRSSGGRESDFESFSFGFGAGGPFGGRGRPEEDILSHIFGGRSGAGRGRPAKGDDVSVTLTVTLEEAASEAKRRVTLPSGRDVDVMIPRGVADGQVVRLRGLGHEGARGGEPGDALLTIKLAPHAQFTVEGVDLRHRLPVPLEDAVLGATLRVPTLTGAVEMRIPPMTSSGRTFRLRGKGLPGKAATGDLLVTTEITLPAEPDEMLLDFARKRRAVDAN